MRKQILLIDDDPIIACLLLPWLKAKGYDVTIAFDGKSGLEKLKKKKADLVILDIMMPKMNGYTFYAFLKYNEKYKSIPVIMLTARKEVRDKTFDEDVQPDAYITKPFKMNMLINAIEKLVSV